MHFDRRPFITKSFVVMSSFWQDLYLNIALPAESVMWVKQKYDKNTISPAELIKYTAWLWSFQLIAIYTFQDIEYWWHNIAQLMFLNFYIFPWKLYKQLLYKRTLEVSRNSSVKNVLPERNRGATLKLLDAGSREKLVDIFTRVCQSVCQSFKVSTPSYMLITDLSPSRSFVGE